MGVVALALMAALASVCCLRWCAVYRRRNRDQRRQDALGVAEDGTVFTLNLVYNRSFNTPAASPVACLRDTPPAAAAPTFTALGASPYREPLLEPHS